MLITIDLFAGNNISLIAVSKSNYDFILVKSLTQIHTNKIVSVFPIETSPRFVTVDDHGCAKITIINAIDPRSNIFKCSFCENPRTALCSQCQTPLFQRDDDKPEAIKARLEVYKQNITPLINFYGDKVFKVSSAGTPEETYRPVKLFLERLK